MKIMKIRREAGFTLIELMVTIAIFGIVLSGVYAAFISQFNSYQTQEDVSIVQGDLRSASEILTRDIRNAGYGAPSFMTTVAAATSQLISLNLSTTSAYLTTTPVAIGGGYILAVSTTSGFQTSQKYNVVDIRTKTVTMGGTGNLNDIITAVGPGKFVTVAGTLSGGFALNPGDLLVTPGVQSFGYNAVTYQIPTSSSVCNGVINVLTRTDTAGVCTPLSNNITGFSLNYILTNGTSTSTPALNQITAVSFTLTGNTTKTISKMSGVQRSRTVSTIVALRN